MLMKLHLCALTVFTLVVFSFVLSAQSKGSTKNTPVADPKDLIEGKVVSVENGDTIIVQVDADVPLTYLVKLQAVDAPDIGQPYYENSRNALSKLVYKKEVEVVVNTIYDKGMVIGTVFRDGRDIGLGMLEKGFAWHYKRFAYQQPSSDRKSYADAQDYASTAGLGLWSENRPTPPWIFRGENPAGTSASAPATSAKGVAASPSGTAIRSSAVTPTSAPAASTSGTSNSGRKYILGPRGGCYYVSSGGGKVYVKDKSRCGVSQSGAKP